MRIPILYTLSWPDRIFCSEVTWPRLDLCKYDIFTTPLLFALCNTADTFIWKWSPRTWVLFFLIKVLDHSYKPPIYDGQTWWMCVGQGTSESAVGVCVCELKKKLDHGETPIGLHSKNVPCFEPRSGQLLLEFNALSGPPWEAWLCRSWEWIYNQQILWQPQKVNMWIYLAEFSHDSSSLDAYLNLLQ